MTPPLATAPARSVTQRARLSALVGAALVVSLPMMSLPAQAATPTSVQVATTTTPAPAPTPAETAPATTTPAPTAHTYLRYGDRGSRVKALQKLLRVKRTGIFDSRTRTAVKKVQQRAKLKANGIVTARTMKAIKREAKRRAAARALPRAGGPAASKRYAKAYIKLKYKWGATQFSCLAKVWQRESGWRYWASNPNGRYHGIPQTSSAVWRAAGYSTKQYMKSPSVQIKVGTRYIKGRYGTPCRAWAFWRSHHWY